jgi:hypothetical protein
MMSDLVSELVSVRIPTCPLKCAKLVMRGAVFGDRHIREMQLGSCTGRKHIFAQERVARDGQPIWAIWVDRQTPEWMTFFSQDS